MSAITLTKVLTLAPHLPGDPQGAALLASAVEWCERHCGRKFDSAVVTDERSRTVRDDAPREIRHYLYVARPPVTGVASLWLDESETDSSLHELVQDGGRAERLLIKTYEDTPGYASRINYTGGWTDATVPDGLVLVVATLMGRLLDRLLHGAVSNESSGGENVNYLSEGQFFGDVRTMLAPYRLRTL